MIAYSNQWVHWNYFLALQDDFSKMLRYIEPCEQNNKVFSIELAHLILAATQEVDVLLKLYCCYLDSAATLKNVHNYFSVISNKQSEILQSRVVIHRFGMESQPFSGWTHKKPPLWWTANNNIKHHRDQYFDQATFKNAFNAIAALLAANVFYYQAMLKNQAMGSEWSDVSTYLDLTWQRMLFWLQEPLMMRVIDGGPI